jgi:GWxTD domain-containing protein
MKRSLLAIPLLILFLNACAARGSRIESDPYFESFFEKARLIMTNEEIQIYKHLPDIAAKDKFIDEFWKTWDPFPETPENESKIEFESRIAYANRWFRENRPPGRGWDTPRGRIFLQLGEPDNRYLTDNTNSSTVKGYEYWIYYDYQLELIFIDKDGFGEFKLRNWPAELLSALDITKFTLNTAERKAMKNAFVFTGHYRDGQIVISIPMKKIRFQETENTISVDYKISIHVYRDYNKIDTAAFSKQFSFAKDKIPAEKTLGFSLPYPLTEKGKYYFDILIEDVAGTVRSRNFVNYKL